MNTESYWAKNPFLPDSVNLIAFCSSESTRPGVRVLGIYFKESCLASFSLSLFVLLPPDHANTVYQFLKLISNALSVYGRIGTYFLWFDARISGCLGMLIGISVNELMWNIEFRWNYPRYSDMLGLCAFHFPYAWLV